MKVIEYKPEFGEYSLPSGLKEALTGKSIEEQMKYFGTACIPQFASQVGWEKSCDKEFLDRRFYKLGADEYVLGVIVDDGIIVGVEIDSYYSGNGISLLKDHTYGITVYEASDNNGAGYKEYTEYRFLIVFPKGYAESL